MLQGHQIGIEALQPALSHSPLQDPQHCIFPHPFLDTHLFDGRPYQLQQQMLVTGKGVQTARIVPLRMWVDRRMIRRFRTSSVTIFRDSAMSKMVDGF